MLTKEFKPHYQKRFQFGLLREVFKKSRTGMRMQLSRMGLKSDEEGMIQLCQYYVGKVARRAMRGKPVDLPKKFKKYFGLPVILLAMIPSMCSAFFFPNVHGEILEVGLEEFTPEKSYLFKYVDSFVWGKPDMERLERRGSVMLSEIFSHPLVDFDIEVTTEDRLETGALGYWSGEHIYVMPTEDDRNICTLMHEIQHALDAKLYGITDGGLLIEEFDTHSNRVVEQAARTESIMCTLNLFGVDDLFDLWMKFAEVVHLTQGTENQATMAWKFAFRSHLRR